jgi:hypothetical protein
MEKSFFFTFPLSKSSLQVNMAVSNDLDISNEVNQYLIFILDESGSMCHQKQTLVHAINKLLDEQRIMTLNDSHDPAKIDVHIQKFSSCMHKPIVGTLDSISIAYNQYNPDGSTALFDTIGRTIDQYQIMADTRDDKVDTDKKIIFVIVTDGQDNMSLDYSLSDIKNMIALQIERGWKFLYLGENLETLEQAHSLGLDQYSIGNYLDLSQTLSSPEFIRELYVSRNG